MPKRDTTETFIAKANKKHNFKYDYHKVKYVNAKTKVIVICKICGYEFSVTPDCHLRGCGCPHCAKNGRDTTETFIAKANKIHNFKYDYHKVKYINSRTKVIVICKICGYEFSVLPKQHLSGSGCPNCANNVKGTTESFVAKANIKHNFIFNYHKVKYVNNHTNVIVICKICGHEFPVLPKHHLSGSGCPHCNHTTETFITKANKKHNFKYDYHKVKYVNSYTKVIVICKICGCEFPVTPTSHLQGCGCPQCRKIVLVDGAVCDSYIDAYMYILLTQLNEPFEYNKKYPKAPNGKHIKNKRYDYYIPSKNMYIELTSFNKGAFKKHNRWRGYLRKIAIKKQYVERELGANFMFIQKEITREIKDNVTKYTKIPIPLETLE